MKDGLHEFSFKAGGDLFSSYPSADIQHADLDISVDLIKKPRLLELAFTITGMVEVVCDRCLDRYHEHVDTSGKLYFKFGEYAHEETFEVIILPEDEFQVDVMHYIYEFTMLALPVKKVHPRSKTGESRCNEQMESILAKHSGKKKMTNDPRWDALRNINNEN